MRPGGLFCYTVGMVEETKDLGKLTELLKELERKEAWLREEVRALKGATAAVEGRTKQVEEAKQLVDRELERLGLAQNKQKVSRLEAERDSWKDAAKFLERNPPQDG